MRKTDFPRQSSYSHTGEMLTKNMLKSSTFLAHFLKLPFSNLFANLVHLWLERIYFCYLEQLSSTFLCFGVFVGTACCLHTDRPTIHCVIYILHILRGFFTALCFLFNLMQNLCNIKYKVFFN